MALDADELQYAYRYGPCVDAGRAGQVFLIEEVAARVAVQVGNAEAAARTSDDLSLLRTTMTSRAFIDEAKGILTERHKVNEDEAFTMLIHASQRTKRNCATWPLSSSGPARCPVDI
jgi:ANTAR domain